MIARGFKPVGWVAGVAAAALGCYMLSLNVAAERAELASIERQIIAARQDIRSLQTELGTRGRMAQLDRWNAEVLALSSPTSAQYLKDEFTLARYDQRPKSIEDRARVQLASADARPKPKLQAKVAAPVYAAAAVQPAEPKSLVRRASLIVEDSRPLARSKPLAAIRKASFEADKAPAAAEALPKAARPARKLEAEGAGQ